MVSEAVYFIHAGIIRVKLVVSDDVYFSYAEKELSNCKVGCFTDALFVMDTNAMCWLST